MAKKRAFIAREDQEGRCVVVFARTRGEARHKGAGRLEVDFIGVSINRAPKLDRYMDKGRVPRKVLAKKHDWWFTCLYCCNRVTSDNCQRWEGDWPVCDRHPVLPKRDHHV